MNEIRLNGTKMVDKATTHAYLKRKLALPAYYGENLDALWDCLSTDSVVKVINIHSPAAITKNLGAYGESLIKLFEEVAEENKRITINIIKDRSDGK